MSNNIKPNYHLFLLVLALFPVQCLAMSFPNSPCDVGDGFFFYKPSHNNFSNEGWHIFFQEGSQKIICYHIDKQDDYAKSVPPDYYDFDKEWVFIQASDHRLKSFEQPQSEKSKHLAYFLFNKESREMSGPLTPEEFFEHPATTNKEFDWKLADHKETHGAWWTFPVMLFLHVCIPYILFAILLVIIGKWTYELLLYLYKKARMHDDSEQSITPYDNWLEQKNHSRGKRT